MNAYEFLIIIQPRFYGILFFHMISQRKMSREKSCFISLHYFQQNHTNFGNDFYKQRGFKNDVK